MIFSGFAKKLIAEWRRLNLAQKGKTVVVAVSGGADSLSLLAALDELLTLKKLNLKFVVAHFNHNLRGAESDEDADFARKLAEKFNLEFVCETWNPECGIPNLKDNLEQAARHARYLFLSKAARKHAAYAVLTAHTLDDQAETFLLRLIRGSAADGLGAMQPIRVLESKIQNPKSKIQLVRPLLSWARREMTENYCRQIGLNFRRDAMNDDENFARIRIRKQLVPLLKTFNPNVVKTISNTADLLREDAEELNAQAQRFLNDNSFPLLAVHCALLTTALRRRVLRLWLRGERGDLRRIDAQHLRAIETLVTSRQGGRTIQLPGHGAVTRQNGALIFVPQVEKTEADI